MRERLHHQVAPPHRSTELLRRNLVAHAIQGSEAHTGRRVIHPSRDGNGRMSRCLHTLPYRQS